MEVGQYITKRLSAISVDEISDYKCDTFHGSLNVDSYSSGLDKFFGINLKFSSQGVSFRLVQSHFHNNT